MNDDLKKFIQEVKNFHPTSTQKARLENVVLGLNKFLTETVCCVKTYKNILELSKINKDDRYKSFNTIKKPLVLGIDVSLYLHKFVYSQVDQLYFFLSHIFYQ